MAAALRVRLESALKHAALPASAPVLDPSGPFACIGGRRGADDLAVPVTPDATSLFGPRGACLMDRDGPLWIADTGHHRLLGWNRIPDGGDRPADHVIGQPGFLREGRNAKSAAGGATLNVPTGIARCAGGFAVADAWNHRVLVWRSMPERDNVPADLVLGQADFGSVEPNRGARGATAGSLFWPYGVHWDGARLWVADTGNRRVLMWNGLPARNGAAPDLVLGQQTFDARDENGGGAPTAASMRWPHAIAVWAGRLCVSDAGNNRVMVWDRLPHSNNAPCDRILGQCDALLVDHNRSLYWPSAASLNMPYGIGATGRWLVAADTANSRLVAWQGDSLDTDAEARALTGQPDYHAKGDNRWQLPSADSLCWPYGIAIRDGIAAVSDSGNNRVLLWRLSQELRA